MSWLLYRWTWQLESPLYIGMAPAGSINRCRLYVPARNLWGAVTAELARQKAAAQFPNYQQVGNEIKNRVRFTYLYPAEKHNSKWCAWLPKYELGLGLVWKREGNSQESLQDRDIRMRLLHTRPGTAIDPSSDTAEEGSLHETECMNTFWRDTDGCASSPVGLVGYVFMQDTASSSSADLKLPDDLQSLRTLFVGGDTRYGLGELTRTGELIDAVSDVFGQPVELSGDKPMIRADRILGHAIADEAKEAYGQCELLLGWDDGKIHVPASKPLWQPGSYTKQPQLWAIDGNGFWRLQGQKLTT
ncbi:MAG: hypothetical protein AB1563_13910 [Bacillota bacterium]|jgi:hypothetical protein